MTGTPWRCGCWRVGREESAASLAHTHQLAFPPQASLFSPSTGPLVPRPWGAQGSHLSGHPPPPSRSSQPGRLAPPQPEPIAHPGNPPPLPLAGAQPSFLLLCVRAPHTVAGLREALGVCSVKSVQVSRKEEESGDQERNDPQTRHSLFQSRGDFPPAVLSCVVVMPVMGLRLSLCTAGKATARAGGHRAPGTSRAGTYRKGGPPSEVAGETSGKK